MSRFIAWLKDEPRSFRRLVSVIFHLTALNYIYVVLTANLFLALGWLEVEEKEVMPIGLGLLILLVPILAFIEELIFRFIPLSIVAAATNKNVWVLLAVSVASSVVFGYAHYGWISIPLQGVGGMILAVLFLKCGCLNGGYIKAIAVTTVAHSFYNWLVMVPIWLFG